MTFNMKKAKTDMQETYQERLKNYREEMSMKEPVEGITELQFKHNQHKDKDNSVPFNIQLSEARTGTLNVITNKSLDKDTGTYNKHRDNRTHGLNAKSQDLVAEAYDQKKLEAFKKSQEGQDRDTDFWDKEVGIQMQGKKTTIINNKQESQLPNHPDRYSGLKPDLGEKKVRELVMAEVKQADKLQFQLFAQASYEDRKLTDKEKQMIQDINGSKAELINRYEQIAEKYLCKNNN